METRKPERTRLQRALTAFRLKSLHVVKTAELIAGELGRPGISRQHFSRLKSGRAMASEERIFIVVAAFRELTGRALRACDLFDVEPETGSGALRPLSLAAAAAVNGGNASVPLSSNAHSSPWRVFVPDEPGQRDTQEFEELYTQYGVLLRSIAMRRFGVPPDDAEALVHDTFVAYLERHTIIRDVKRWLMGAVGNACKNYWRARKREAPRLPEHDETADPAADEAVEQRMRRSAVVAVLAQLGTKCRETLRRYYLGEETKEAIAEELSTSPGYVLKLLIACRQRAYEVFCGLMGRKK